MAQKKTMRAVDIQNGAGPASALFINSAIPRPEPRPNECLIRIKAFGINRADTLQRQGKYPLPPGVSTIMGLEFSGIIEEVGSADVGDKHDWKAGDEVLGLAYGGCYAEYVAVSKRMLIRKPKEMSWIVAGGLCEAYFTALQALHLVGEYDPATTKTILWHAGGSGVSLAGIQLSLAANEHAHHITAQSSTSPNLKQDHPPPRVFTTARTPSKLDFCVRHLGATGAINTSASDHAHDWPEELRRLNDGQGADLIIDYMGASYFQQNLAALNRDGRAVQLGAMGGMRLEGVDMSAFVFKRIRWQGSTLRTRDEVYQGRLRDLFEDHALPRLVNGQFESGVEGEGHGMVFEWEKIAEAHKAMEENRNLGKIVCVVGG